MLPKRRSPTLLHPLPAVGPESRQSDVVKDWSFGCLSNLEIDPKVGGVADGETLTIKGLWDRAVSRGLLRLMLLR